MSTHYGTRAAWFGATLLILSTASGAGPMRPAHAAAHGTSGPVELETLFADLYRLSPDPGQFAKVSGLVIKRDAATLTFDEGELALARPVAGRVCAAYFSGRGHLKVAPSQSIERKQLIRRLKSPELDHVFTSAVLIFADSTAEELARLVSFETGRFNHVVAESPDNLRGLIVSRTAYVDPSLARTLLEGRRDDSFIALTVATDRERYSFRIDPYATEEVKLSRPGDGGIIATEVISQFRLGGAPSDDLDADHRPGIHVRYYQMDIRLESAMTPVYRTALSIEVAEDSLRYIPFYLSDFQDAPDSVSSTNGAVWKVHSHRENPVVWFDAGRMLHRREKFQLRMRHHGAPMANWANLPTLHSSTNWYPIHSGGDRAFFDLTFHYARPMELISVGDSVSREEDPAGNIHARWRTSVPIDNASWHLGLFETMTAQLDSLPEVRLINYAGSHARFGWELQQAIGVNTGKAVARPVGNDIAGSLRFFQDHFGSIPAERLFAFESYEVHGQAFPNMIALDWTTFQVTDPWGRDEILRAHEVAHQWWGIHVGSRTYRDAWLTEGLAEFSGLWYMQAKRRDTKLYLSTLKDMRERILGTPNMPSVWLGYRAREWRMSREGYTSAIYLKGAWIFHMLRCMLIDLDDLNDVRFTELLRDYATRRGGGRASTQDLERIAGSHAGEPLDWFFRQWVRDTDIPTYRYWFRTERTDKGKYRVTLHVEQRGVPEDFKMPVPVRIELPDGQVARTRVWVDRPVVDVSFPLLDVAPAHLEFNDLSAVLCRLESPDD